MDEGGTIGISCKVLEGVMVHTKVLKSSPARESQKALGVVLPLGLTQKMLLVNRFEKSEQS